MLARPEATEVSLLHPFMLQLLVLLMQAVGITAALAIGFGVLRRCSLPDWQRSALIGVMFGLGAVVLSFSPAQLAPGVVVDGRAIFVGFAAAFAGPPAFIAAAVVNAIARIWLVGGLGTPMHVVGPVIAGAMGLLWERFILKKHGASPGTLALLGLMISSTALLLFVLPFEIALPIFLSGWPLMMLASVAASVSFGLFLRRELDQVEREALLKKAAFRDELTGLHNRRSFDAEVTTALKKTDPLFMFMIDVDHFKHINDRYGHAFGDHALRVLTSSMKATVRSHDIVGRLGGEEFGILSTALDVDQARSLADSLLASARSVAISHRGTPVALTVSIGVSQARSGDSASRVFVAADKALYRAKRSGRNRYEFSPDVSNQFKLKMATTHNRSQDAA